MNKSVVRKVALKDQGNDFEFWQTKSYEERLSVLEELRRDYCGWKEGSEPRMQKNVYRRFMRKAQNH